MLKPNIIAITIIISGLVISAAILFASSKPKDQFMPRYQFMSLKLDTAYIQLRGDTVTGELTQIYISN